MRHKQQDRQFVIQGKPAAPADSWWAVASPEHFTEYVTQTHLTRMRLSKFSSLSLGDRPVAVPSNDAYVRAAAVYREQEP